MSSKNFPRKVKIERGRASLLKHCVTLFYTTELDLASKREWCFANVGSRRKDHPLWEITDGWVNNDSGDWAYDIQLSYNQWWFARKEDKLAFRLVFCD